MVAAAVIFDLDGTLIDSEGLHLAAERAALARYGAEITDEQKLQFVGRGIGDIIQGFIDLFGLDVGAAELTALRNAYYEESVHTVKGFPATTELVVRLRTAGLPMAVASGSAVASIEKALDAIGLLADFPVRVSAEEVVDGKPAPDIFLEAARQLGVDPSACVVVEDAAPGVLAAHAAGMPVVAIPTITDPLDEVFRTADLLFPEGMDAVDVDAIMSLVNDHE